MQSSFAHTFEKIASIENIRGAYLDLARKFDLDSKSTRYRGVDGLKMPHLDFSSLEVIDSIRQEILDMKKISPAYMATIPKKNGKKRKIYAYPLKERIKAEAIYRVLLPSFDAYFSPFLFSYRSSHPSYYAARSAVRRYKRYYGENHILVTDISDYADTIDHDILLEKLLTLGLDEGTLKLLKLFIKTDTFEEGRMVVRPRGVLTGTPLYALLSNFYMDDFDKWAGKYIAFYRRVGDDIICMDKDAEKIAAVSERLSETVVALKLKLNKDKARLIKDSEAFTFLGYEFKNGKISFDKSSRAKTISAWKKLLHPGPSKNRSTALKVRRVQFLAKTGTNNLHNQFKQLIEQKKLVDDTASMKAFSERFLQLLTAYFKGTYSPKKRREVAPLLQKTGVPSLFEYYRQARYPKAWIQKPKKTRRVSSTNTAGK